MATTIQSPRTQQFGQPVSGGPGGGNSAGNGDLRLAKEYAPPPASSAMWVLITGISMTFLAFTSALVVRKGGASDWQHLTLPSILYLTTLILLASSVTLQIGRREVDAFMTGTRRVQHPARWLYVSLALGFLFVAGQYLAWRELRSQGIYLATNPSSSFFYVFTVAHVLHLSGGLAGLTRVLRKLHFRTLHKSTLDATSRYWHFMDFLWVYLFFLLWMKL